MGEHVALLDEVWRTALRVPAAVVVGGTHRQAHDRQEEQQPSVCEAGAGGPVETFEEGPRHDARGRSADGRDREQAEAGEHMGRLLVHTPSLG